MKRFEWVRADGLADALQHLAESRDHLAHAGGVDLVDRLKEGLVQPRRLVALRGVRELEGVRTDGDGSLRLGAMVTLAEAAAHPEVRARHPVLAEACLHAATPQVRNMATLGGNLVQRPRCWYFRSADFHCRKKGGELCFAQKGENQYHAIFGNRACAIVHPSTPATALVALAADVRLKTAKGERVLPLERFFQAPEIDLTRENQLADGELIVEVRVPPPPGTRVSAYLKQGEKESFDWPLVDCAVVLELDGGTCKRASIVLGAVAPVPHRASQAEHLLAGRAVDEKSAAQAAHAALAGATPLGKNGYKVALAEAVVKRTILAAAHGGAT